MSLSTNVTDLATRVATEAKALRTLINGNTADLAGLTTTAKGNLVAALNEVAALDGDLSTLDTTAKSTLVAAINEVKGIADAAAGGGVSINDSATNGTQAWSSSKIDTEISAAVSALVDSAPGALDTLNELAAAIADDAAFSATVTTALGNRVRTDTAAQGLNATQQGNARTNIDAASATAVGDTAADFVATFNAGLV